MPLSGKRKSSESACAKKDWKASIAALLNTKGKKSDRYIK